MSTLVLVLAFVVLGERQRVDHGAIDQICDRREMRERLATLLAMMMRQEKPAHDTVQAA